jgi:hypothetical protein
MIAPPLLPLVLWDTPPGLEQILQQEGIAHVRARSATPLALRAGRFVLFDSRRRHPSKAEEAIGPDQVLLDLEDLRRGEATDPFRDLLETRSERVIWTIDGIEVSERVHRVRRAEIRQRLLKRLRDRVLARGGVWMRLAAYPFPYRSAFGFRVDLDEPVPEDYHRFARARRSIEKCVTHFVSTAAYAESPDVLEDLARLDTQSHGHHHHVYREAEANRRNLERAAEILRRHGIVATGFAGPGGRWNVGLDSVLEDLGYQYASEFQIGYDDVPFFPWRGDRFSTVLQVPIHPICEGLFFESGVVDPEIVSSYLVGVIRRKTTEGAPAFLYGHPERRLGRFPEIVTALAQAVENREWLWLVTMTEFVRWWRWRAELTWSVIARDEGVVELLFDDWEDRHPLAIELVQGDHVATVPITEARLPLRTQELVFERRGPRFDPPHLRPARHGLDLRTMIREALDWERVTPVDDLQVATLTQRVKRRLRRFRDRVPGAGGVP